MQIDKAVVKGMPGARFANLLLFTTSKNSRLHYIESGSAAETLDLLPRGSDRWYTAWSAATDSKYYPPETLFNDIAVQRTSSATELPPEPPPTAKL